jgi:phytoene synthase
MTATRSLDESLAACRAIVKERAGNFYWGLRLLPEPKRSALYALYAWMRAADDLVDDCVDRDVSRSHLKTFGTRTQEVLSGGRVPAGDDDAMWVGLSWLATEWDIPHKPFADMLRGQSDDLSGRVIQSADDLIEYCQMVASTVGVLCISIWGYSDPKAVDLAVQRGIALQLTNILRDVGEDAAQGRCYIPIDDLRSSGLDPASVASWGQPATCDRVLRLWIEKARSCYQESAPLEEMVSEDCRRTLCAMTAIYAALLDRIEHDPSRCCHIPGVRLSKLSKVWIALRSGRKKS